jgi:hypothetical protein
MKKILLPFILFCTNTLCAQPPGFTNVASHTGQFPYTVGDIFINAQSGGLAVFVNSSLIVSVKETDNERNFVVYPNPAGNVAFIQSVDGKQIKSVKLIDSQAREIPVRWQDGMLDVSSLQSGMFFLFIDDYKRISLIIE